MDYLLTRWQLLLLITIFLILVLEAITYLYTNRKKHLFATAFFLLFYIILSIINKSTEYMELLTSFLGIIFLCLEALVPGMQIFGFVGGTMLILGFGFMLDSYLIAISVVIGILLIAVLYISFLKKRGYRLKAVRKLVLNDENSSDKGYLTNQKKDLVNKIGVTTTPLRPSGFGEIDGVVYDFYSYEGFIEAGVKVKVVKEESMKIFVRRI